MLTQVGIKCLISALSYRERSQGLEQWQRAKRITPLLKDDSQYHIWRIAFVPEFNVQWMICLIDRDLNPLEIHDHYEKEFLTLQQFYFLTVLTHVFKNPLGITSLQEYLPRVDHDILDAISCYFKHQYLQDHSLTQPLHVVSQQAAFAKLHIQSHCSSKLNSSPYGLGNSNFLPKHRTNHLISEICMPCSSMQLSLIPNYSAA